MTQDLKFEYNAKTARSYCTSHDDSFGCLYTWSAAMDSAGVYSDNGKGCGYNKKCSPTKPVQGVCPKGWHLPDTSEVSLLITSVGGSGIANTVLRSTTLWQGTPGTDAYGFSVLPSGYMNENATSRLHQFIYANFWISEEKNIETVYYVDFTAQINKKTSIDLYNKQHKRSVRCLKDY